MADSYIRGSRPRQLPRPSRTYGADRVCAHDGCETRISVYNKSKQPTVSAEVGGFLTRGERRKKTAA